MFKVSSARLHQKTKNKKKLKKAACERYKNLTKKEKNKKKYYGCKHNKNLSEDEKQILVDYGKKI